MQQVVGHFSSNRSSERSQSSVPANLISFSEQELVDCNASGKNHGCEYGPWVNTPTMSNRTMALLEKLNNPTMDRKAHAINPSQLLLNSARKLAL